MMSNTTNINTSKMLIAQTKGLLNMPGQNNCFLNSAVQVLWHLDIFRRSFRDLCGHACMGHDACIFCALKELFIQFQYSQETALPPDSLRRALAETFSDQRRFQLGFMDDAAECFENMLLRLHYHLAETESEDHCVAPHCISHRKFAMQLEERINCSSCGANSEPLPFTQLVHYVSVSALCSQARKFFRLSAGGHLPVPVSFGELLRTAGALGDTRDCPKACGTRVQIKKTLFNAPDIVSIGLVWDSERPNIAQISEVFKFIGTSLRLQDVFDDQMKKNCPQAGQVNKSSMNGGSAVIGNVLQLVGLVTYYGKHYSTFFYHTKLAAWIYFDDATVREIGPQWQQVIDKCVRGHFQPLLLLYANPDGTPVDTETAPRVITTMTHTVGNRKKFSPAQAYLSCGNAAAKRNALLNQQQSQQQEYVNLRKQTIPNDLNLINNFHSPSTQLNLTRFNRHRPGSVDDLLNNYASASEDVPDSPLTKSSTSSAYFSDIGEPENGSQAHGYFYHQQQQQNLTKKFQRSSASSIDSFVEANARVMARNYEDTLLLPSKKVCTLQRRDSGNSSNSSAGSGGGSAGSNDRNSQSSGSSVTSENAYYTAPMSSSLKSNFLANASSNIMHGTSSSSSVNNMRKERSNGQSDYGYDSYSLSSSDSFPVNGLPLSPSKALQSVHWQLQQQQQRKLSQIPEDVQFLGLLNGNGMLDCDTLCAEADVLLLQSHEHERAGEIKEAAALSDSAAQKARSAMEAPYSSRQALISAKMKHSMCVMRSASLHRRIRETEAEEKRRQRAESLQALHSRQGSRDSLHSGKHGRSSSSALGLKDSEQQLQTTDNHQRVKTMELYGTLPKKSLKKKLLSQNSMLANSVSSLRIKDEHHYQRSSLLASLALTAPSTQPCKQQMETSSRKSKLLPKNSNSMKEQSDFSDYYSELETKSTNSKIPVHKSLSGSISGRETESEFYADIGELNGQAAKKQNRVRRKLLMGSFMKRKNRSLPDLRDGAENTSVDTLQLPKSLDDSQTPKTVAQVSRKGFHALHTDKSIYQKASLLKVSPPNIAAQVVASPAPVVNSSPKQQQQKQTSTTQSTTAPTVVSTIKYLLNSHKLIKKDVSSSAVVAPQAPTPPPPPPNAVNDTHQLSVSLGIEPCDELPPPPEDFLEDLREMNQQQTKVAATTTTATTTVGVLSQKKEKVNIDSSNSTKEMPIEPKCNRQKSSVKDLASKFEKLANFTVINSESLSSSPSTATTLESSSSVQTPFNCVTTNNNNHASTHHVIAPSSITVTSQSPLSQTNIAHAQTAPSPAPSVKVNLPSSSSLSSTTTIQSNQENKPPITLPSTGTTHQVSTPSINGQKSVTNNSTTVQRPANIYGTLKNIDHTVGNSSKSFIPPPSPSLSVSSSTYGCARPERPPDYQTAMKRLGLMKAEMSTLMQSRFGSTNSPTPSSTLSNNSSTCSSNSNTLTKCGAEELGQPIKSTSNANNRNNKRLGAKKSVSFSDQVVLVAPAEAEEEEHFPNPLLDRILANSNILSMK